jgi:hypothetical protein
MNKQELFIPMPVKEEVKLFSESVDEFSRLPKSSRDKIAGLDSLTLEASYYALRLQNSSFDLVEQAEELKSDLEKRGC